MSRNVVSKDVVLCYDSLWRFDVPTSVITKLITCNIKHVAFTVVCNQIHYLINCKTTRLYWKYTNVCVFISLLKCTSNSLCSSLSNSLCSSLPNRLCSSLSNRLCIYLPNRLCLRYSNRLCSLMSNRQFTFVE